ncbi:substrate-binding periplasmic protein [Litoribrevibacter albus]|uniref:Polar amino acid ABC transporter n=1 Tax=Litoribrevibacter albus TaxID=1473156 RepID=A0AA37SDC7_9GAMM|nr:transporter substrate-binding domain-containing protein [Litoribrevibacter albus]GLQ32298.1 polar amino acid ABC transporter [Litoribrevibacter albus]
MSRLQRSLAGIAVVLSISSPNLQADNLKLAVGLALPPYVISETNSGMELDVVREALKLVGHTAEAVYLPFGRVPPAVTNGDVDAALTVNESSGLDGVKYSDSHITYQNVAVSLAVNNFSINQISDLSGHSIIAFQDATKYLGDAYASMAGANKRYSEKAKQSKQITMLFAERVDCVVMDINIFKFFKAAETQVKTDRKVVVHEIFEPSNYKVGFRKQTHRDDFNKGLAQLKASGRYVEILRKYVQ